MNLYDENLHAEKDQLHFGLFDGRENLVACVIAAGQSPTETKIRQMAVAPEEQGKGYGRTLLESVESVLSARGVTNLSMHARKTAAGFYATLGYMTYGNDFIEVGLPHVEMRKRLT
ncbi:MAG: GNAT family N-acetyltransferase [Kiritimatiellia bacterium]